MMILELILVFLVLFGSSFVLFYLIYKQDDPAVTGMVTKVNGHDKSAKKQKVKEIKSLTPTGILTSKWVEFGGGFYGLVAVLTYLIIEVQEVIELLSSEGGILEAIGQLGIGTLINFFIESLLNFITAITWPVYWMGEGSAPFWQWFVAAYAGYFVGQIVAKWSFNNNSRQQGL